MAQITERPTGEEYFEFYQTYVGKVPEGDVVAFLEDQARRLAETFSAIPAEHEGFAYAPGKWTLRQLLGHITDAERVFSYRALTIGRGDQTPLPGFDENVWAEDSNADRRQLDQLVEEFLTTRDATVALYRGFDSEQAMLRGTASGHTVSVRALAWITAGHAEHHLQLVHERYLPGLESC